VTTTDTETCEHGLSAWLCAGPGHYPPDDYAPAATESEAHAEWHRNAGVPMGPSGGSCPWDACGWADDDLYAAWDPRAEDTEADPEDYAELDAMLADEAADAWSDPNAFDPPF
jgi:hypothetical protein